MRASLATALPLAFALLVAAPAGAQDRGLSMVGAGHDSEARTALVIGNARYEASPLRNPANDARLMARTLSAMGFDVRSHTDLDQNGMKRAIRDFGRRLRDEGGVGLFYFAGHGMQVNGENYLIPVGASVESESDVDIEGIRIAEVLAKMDGARNRMNVVILDACRNNPFARSFRSASRGLAFMNAPSGTLVAYATAPGSVAADGSGDNGVYTQHLVRAMQTEGEAIEDVFKQARAWVQQETSGRQVPWESSSLTGDFYFHVAAARPTTRPSSAGPAPARRPPAALASGRFERLEDGAILDQKTGLYWFAPDDRRTYSWKDAREEASDLRVAGVRSWRLPTHSEIEALDDADYAQWHAALSGVRTSPGNRYWLSKTPSWGRALAVHFRTRSPSDPEKRAASEKMRLLAVAEKR